MTKPGATLFYFGWYVIIMGILFLSIPASFVAANQLPPIPDNWARVIGLLSLVIGTYDILCGRYDIRLFIQWSVYVRFGFALGILVLVLTSQMPSMALILGCIDAGAAVWTLWAIKTEGAAVD